MVIEQWKPVLDEFEKRQIPLVFYTSSPDDPFFDCHYDYVKGEYIGKTYLETKKRPKYIIESVILDDKDISIDRNL